VSALSSISSANTQFRIFEAVLDAGASGAGCEVGGAIVRRWYGQTKQMVDVFPEEAVHEQKLGFVEIL
jgi:hypothetical protein